MKHLKHYSRRYLAELKRRAMQAKPGVKRVSHITPRAYCVAKPALHYALFVVPHEDREPQVRNDVYTCVNNQTCKDVEVGAWYSLAYVSTGHSGEPVVI